MTTTTFVGRTAARALAAGLTLAALIPQSAQAAIMLMTRTSVITDVEGAASRDLIGTTMTITLKYDTRNVDSYTVGDLTETFIEKTESYDPVLELSYAFGGGEPLTFRPADGTFLLSHAKQPGRLDRHNLRILPRRDGGDEDPRLFIDLIGYSSPGEVLIPQGLDTPFRTTSADQGELAFLLPDGTGMGFKLGDGETTDGTTVVREFDPNAVPEPGAWALMITGFGLAGATLRRRAAAQA